MEIPEDVVKFIEEVESVCKKHGFVLTGSCTSEGILGEICISKEPLQGSTGKTRLYDSYYNDPNIYYTDCIA